MSTSFLPYHSAAIAGESVRNLQTASHNTTQSICRKEIVVKLIVAKTKGRDWLLCELLGDKNNHCIISIISVSSVLLLLSFLEQNHGRSL